MRPARLWLGLPLALLMLSAGCGSSSRPAASTTPEGGAVTATQPSTTSTATTATTPAGTSTAAGAAVPRCRAATLALSFLGQQGATGRGELGFALRNTGSASCRAFGYPGVLFLDKAGNGLTTKPTRTVSDFAGPTPERAFDLAPGASASFRLGVSHGIGAPAGVCTAAYGLQAIPPDDTATLKVAIPGGATECGGIATVSPLQPGHSAYP